MSAIEELARIVGNEDLITDPDILTCYSRDESFVKPLKPWAVVKPLNTDEVESIVKWANQTGTPLVPVSSGAPHFRGDSIPSVPGAVIVDLSNLRRIIKIDRRNKMTWIEPGVTWDMLQPELAKQGMRIPMPLIPKKNKSVIASFLEREPMIIPRYHWSLLEPLRCCEVVWGSGEKMWTGEAGDQAGTLEERWSKFLYQVNPNGPYQTDFYRLFSAAQGSMGIITCATVKCEILPQVHKMFVIKATNLSDLIDFSYKILKIRYGHEMFILNGADLAGMLAAKADAIRELKDKLPPWILVLGIAGLERLPEEKVKYQEKEIREIAKQYNLYLEPEIPGVDNQQLLDVISNPSKENYWKFNYKGGSQDIFFITTLNRTPEYVGIMQTVAQRYGYPVQDLGIYVQPLMQGVCCHCEFVIPFDPANQSEVARAQKMIDEASWELMRKEAFFSRPYGNWADMVYRTDMQSTEVLRKIKGIFDPRKVMNPGKLCF